MKQDLLTHLGDVLRPHAQLVAAGIKSERATEILTGMNLRQSSGNTLTNTFREQLKTIARGIDINLNALLGMCTTEQLAQVVEDHRHIKWSDPDSDDRDKTLVLSGITKDPDTHKWWLSFEVFPFVGDEGSYLLHDLEIQDTLGLMATIENIIIP